MESGPRPGAVVSGYAERPVWIDLLLWAFTIAVGVATIPWVIYGIRAYSEWVKGVIG
jgi:hypothetical protein